MLIESSVKYVFAQTHTCNSIHLPKQTHELQKTTDIGSGFQYWLANKKWHARGKYIMCTRTSFIHETSKRYICCQT